MTCELCGRGPQQGISIFRVNEKGVAGIWRCEDCVDKAKPVPPDVLSLVKIIEDGK